jgi:hypothetical protein
MQTRFPEIQKVALNAVKRPPITKKITSSTSQPLKNSMVNLKDCHDILVLDRKYLLENLDFILAWAKKETLRS